jgi:hypothetical protein
MKRKPSVECKCGGKGNNLGKPCICKYRSRVEKNGSEEEEEEKALG